MRNITEFEYFERAVMKKLLEGEEEILDILRKQYELAQVKKRDFSGAGFFTSFQIPKNAPKLDSNKSFQIGDLIAEMQGVNEGVSFVLFIKDGLIDFLEGYSYDEKWPETIGEYQLSYISGPKRNFDKLRAKWK